MVTQSFATSDGTTTKLRDLLRPLAGHWVALSDGWDRVIASDPDHQTCVRKARECSHPGEIPQFYKISLV